MKRSDDRMAFASAHFMTLRFSENFNVDIPEHVIRQVVAFFLQALI